MVTLDAYENGIAAMRRFAREQPRRLLTTLLAAAREGSTEAIRFLLECMSDQVGIGQLRKIAWSLYRRIACAQGFADHEYNVLDQVVARITELEVAALGGGPPLFAPASPSN